MQNQIFGILYKEAGTAFKHWVSKLNAFLILNMMIIDSNELMNLQIQPPLLAQTMTALITKLCEVWGIQESIKRLIY